MAHVPGPMTLKRIHKELADLKKEDLGTITLAPIGDSLFDFLGSIPGPQGSVYDGGVFKVDVHLSHDYPFSAPKVLFKTRIFHMNISDHGAVCLDILKTNWSPALSLFKVMLSLSSLLTDPNPKDPLVPNIAQLYLRDRKSHDDTAKRWTELYAIPKPPAPAPPPSSKAKGKQKASAPTSLARASTNASTSLRARVRTGTPVVLVSDEPITLSDSDSETSSRRKRKGPPEAAEVIELDDDKDEQGSGTGGGESRRRSKRQRRDPPISNNEVIELD